MSWRGVIPWYVVRFDRGLRRKSWRLGLRHLGLLLVWAFGWELARFSLPGMLIVGCGLYLWVGLPLFFGAVALVMRRWRVLAWAVVTLAALFCVLQPVAWLDRRHRAESQQRVDVIAAALERYRGEHGDYPQALSRLVPEQLAVLPELPYWIGSLGIGYSKDEDDYLLSFSHSWASVPSRRDSEGWQR